MPAGLQAGGAGSLLHSILKQPPANNQQGNHSTSQLAKQRSSCISAIYQGLRGKALRTALQLPCFHTETGQMSGCFGSAGGKLLVANHCEEATEVVKNLGLAKFPF